jgi:lysozyme family protein
MSGYQTFLDAVAIVLTHEGGLVDDADDPGGLTNMGVTLRDYPQLGANGIRTLTHDQATAIYWTDWWMPNRYGQLPPDIGAKVFDLAVNAGAGTVAKILQQAIASIEHAGLAVDGRIGPATCQAAHCCDPVALRTAFVAGMQAHYRALVAANPSLDKFLAGWLARAAS